MEDILDEIDKTLPGSLRMIVTNSGMDRFHHLRAQKRYIRNLWQMTQDYVDSTEHLLESLFSENTQREFRALRLITIVGVFTGFFGMNIGFPWEERWSQVMHYSFGVVALIAIFAFLIGTLMTHLISFRSFAASSKISPHPPSHTTST